MVESDVQLIRRILSGDEAAFSTLVQKHQKSVHALVWRKIGDFHIAEEITQDTFLRVYKSLATLKDPNLFAGWLYVIANRLCINWSEKNNPAIQSLEDTPMEEIEESTYTHYLSEQREVEVSDYHCEIAQKLLQKLPESERTVVTLYYLGEMTAKEIAKFLGVSVNTIKSRIRRARARLQNQEELLISETLGSVQLPTNLIDNIIQEIANIKQTPAPVGKPLLPWAGFGAAAVLVMLLLGVSNQYLTRFQRPYSFEAQSEPTVEIVDAPIPLDIGQPIIAQSSTPLSDEATQLLEHIKTKVTEYNAQFKSGEIEFSITLHQKIPQRTDIFENLLGWFQNILTRTPKEEKAPSYEENGVWRIIYRFDGEREFYDVKARKKMELNGEPLPDWQEAHYQYLTDGKTLYIRKQTDSGWKRHLLQSKASQHFENEFNPRWWGWPPEGLTFGRFIRGYDPVDIKTVKINDTPYHYLRLYKKARQGTDKSWTREIWTHPQKDYHATRVIQYARLATEIDRQGTLREAFFLTRTTYQVTQYEPGIWFPKTVTQEDFNGGLMEEILPDTPESEYPVIMSEALIPQSFREEKLTWPWRKVTVQVHRAAFNIPIAEEDLRFPD